MALIWAAGIIWFAYDFAGSVPQEEANKNVSSATGAPVTDQDANKVTQILSN